jgi:predicted ATPase/DNA-binding SARP family transcriptional activator
MEVRLLGAMEVVAGDGTPLPVPGAKLRALLAVLALEGGRVVATDRLIEELWGGDQPTDVANALQRLVSKLRKTLGSADVIATRPPGYALMIAEDDVDVARAQRLVAAARAAAATGDLERAVALFADGEALWRGAVLADFAYEEFAQPHIARLEELRLSLIEDRVDAELSLRRHTRLVSDLETLVDSHPLRERIRGQLMVALYRSGRQADALRVFQEGRTVLAEELGLDPGPELRRLEAAILAQDASLDAPADPTATSGPTRRRRTNIKASLTPMVGRQTELAEVAKLLHDRRLVTLVGPGGAGKTRLAVETARLVVEQLPDGAFVVELAPIGDPAAVPDGIASTFDLPEAAKDPLTRVCEYCSGKQLLVVLDNCEHLIDAAARTVDELLGTCDGVRVLATSREALRVAGETVWPVPPLDADDAFELFVERAGAADPHFVVDDERAAVVADICARLDGLPLAIELAAARLRAFPLAQVAERLDDRFRLLTGGSRTALPRQQTLRAVVDWSYDLLFTDERRVFERLSVFPGGCTLGAAVAVCGRGDVDAADVEEIISSLIDKSLLSVDRTGTELRFGMLETLSQYGRERLVEHGEADTAYAQMADHLASLCAHGRMAFRGVEQRAWFDSINAELDNLRAAFEWAIAAEEPELAVGLAADLAVHRWVAGKAVDGHRWLETALALPGDVSPLIRGRGLLWRAYLGYFAGQGDDSDADLDEAIALLREHAEPGEVGVALAFYAQIVAETGRAKRAAELNRQSLELVNEASDEPWLRAAATWLRASIAAQGDRDFDTFESLVREAVDQFEQAGDTFMSAIALNIVAEFDERRANYAAAIAALTTAYEMAAGMHVAGFEASLVARLGIVSLQTNDLPGAEMHLEDALRRADELAYPPVRAQALNGLAGLRRRQGRLEEATDAARHALELYRGASGRPFAGSFTSATSRFDVPAGAAASMSVLGFVAELRGDADTALAHHLASLEQARLIGDPRAIALALEGLAGAAALSGDGVQVARLLGHADVLRADERAVRAPSECDDVGRALDAAVALLGRSAFDAAFEQGRRAGLDEVLSVRAGG